VSKLSSFAHLLGLAARGARASSEDDKPDGRRAEGPFDDDPGDEENAKGKRAEDDDLDPDAEEDEGDESDDTPKGKKAKKAKGRRAEGDDDGDPEAEEEDGDEETPKAVRADRSRCAAIVAYGLAHGCAEQAGALAFDTNLGKKAAINVLKAGGQRGAKAPAASLGGRMANLNFAQVGPEANGGELPKGMSAVAAAIIKAGQ